MSDDRDGYIDRREGKKKEEESRCGSFLSYFRRAWSQFDFMIIIIIQCHTQSCLYSIQIKRFT
jgi:hypothetical protein